MMRFNRLRRKRRPPGQAAAPTSPLADQARIRSALQAKLKVGSADNQYEQEADATADRVMAMQPVPGATAAATDTGAQRKCDQCEEEELQGKLAGTPLTDAVQRQPEGEEEEELQTKPGADAQQDLMRRQPEEEEEPLQAKMREGNSLVLRQPGGEEEEEELHAKPHGEGMTLPADLADRIDRRQGGGAPLPASERAFFEPRFGTDFSSVRVHADAEAADLSGAINARAFTLGRDIYFNRGEFHPGANESRHLVAHELTHTIQQGASGPAARESNGGQLQRAVIGSRVSCESSPRTDPIFTTIGTDDPTGTIQTAVTRALALLDDAIETLQYGRDRITGGAPTGWPTISDAVGVSLRQRLRIDPDTTASWTGTGPRTVHQAIRWYSNIRRILASDFMRYTCIDSDCDPGDWAAAIYGQSRIYLCRRWWHDGLDMQAITLVHEASHVYYDTEDSGRGMGSAYCLENFICDINGLDICHGC